MREVAGLGGLTGVMAVARGLRAAGWGRRSGEPVGLLVELAACRVELTAGAVDQGVQLGARGLDGFAALRRAGRSTELVEGARVGDGFTEVGQGVSQRTHRVGELGDLAPGDVGLGVATAAHGAIGESCRGGEVGEQPGDVADPVVEVIEVVAAGVHPRR
ncbi:hypothetical protein [Streptomyces sp. NPDC048641]|uniref:hypothetical protein n=1 Tax=Streptomyces sp. NPDC048641 TaxID=3154825 RepID=UPI0034309F5C